MKETIKRLKLNITFAAVLNIVIGVLLLIFPEASISSIGRVFAMIVIIAGIAIIIGQVVEFGRNVMGIIVGAVVAIIGLWIFASPQAILTIIPIAIGVILVIHGVQDLGMAIEGSRANISRSWLPYLVAVVNIILGFVCIANAFGFVSLAFRLIGIMLIWDGLSDLGIVHKVNHASKGIVDVDIIDEEDIF